MPSFDSSAGGFVNGNLTPSFSQTIGNTALLVGLACYSGVYGNASYTIDVTVGSTPLTKLGAIDCGSRADQGFVALFGLVGPPTGLETIHVNLSGPVNNQPSIDYSSVTYFGVSTLGSAVLASGDNNDGPPSVTVPSASGQTVVAFLGQDGATLSSPTGTVRCQNGYHYNMDSLFEDSPGAASVTLGASNGGGGPWAAIGVNLS